MRIQRDKKHKRQENNSGYRRLRLLLFTRRGHNKRLQGKGLERIITPRLDVNRCLSVSTDRASVFMYTNILQTFEKDKNKELA